MSKFFNDTMNGLLEAVEIKRASNTHSKTLVSYPVIFTDVERNILIETGIIDGQGRISIKFIKDNAYRRIDYLKIVSKTLKLL